MENSGKNDIGVIMLKIGNRVVGKLTVVKEEKTHRYSIITEFIDEIANRGYIIAGSERLKRKIEWKVSHWDLTAMELEKIGDRTFRII